MKILECKILCEIYTPIPQFHAMRSPKTWRNELVRGASAPLKKMSGFDPPLTRYSGERYDSGVLPLRWQPSSQSHSSRGQGLLKAKDKVDIFTIKRSWSVGSSKCFDLQESLEGANMSEFP